MILLPISLPISPVRNRNRNNKHFGVLVTSANHTPRTTQLAPAPTITTQVTGAQKASTPPPLPPPLAHDDRKRLQKRPLERGDVQPRHTSSHAPRLFTRRTQCQIKTLFMAGEHRSPERALVDMAGPAPRPPRCRPLINEELFGKSYSVRGYRRGRERGLALRHVR